jgi:hypothetical protein
MRNPVVGTSLLMPLLLLLEVLWLVLLATWLLQLVLLLGPGVSVLKANNALHVKAAQVMVKEYATTTLLQFAWRCEHGPSHSIACHVQTWELHQPQGQDSTGRGGSRVIWNGTLAAWREPQPSSLLSLTHPGAALAAAALSTGSRSPMYTNTSAARKRS